VNKGLLSVDEALAVLLEGARALDEIETSVGGRPLALEFRPCPAGGAVTEPR